MEIFPLLFGAAFGIGIVSGILLLVSAISRPRNPVYLFFGLSVIASSIHILLVQTTSQAVTLSQYVIILKYGIGPANAIILLMLLWFVVFYTDVYLSRFLLTLTLMSVALLAVHLLLPTGIFASVTGLRHVLFPWGEEITLHQGNVTSWQPAVILWLLATYAFFAYAFYRQWRQGKQAQALLLATPLLLHGLVTVVYDRLIDATIIDAPYLGGAAILLLTIPLSVRLAHTAVRASAALRQHHEEMEELVGTRTAELKRANERLYEEVAERQQAEELLRQILNLLPVGVWRMDGSGQIVETNPAGLKIWGGARYVGPEEFGDYKGWWVDTGQRITAEEWAAARAIAKGETSIGELIEIEAFDGTRKFILNSAVPLRGKGEEVIGAIIVNEDITARRKVQLELEGRVRELSALHEIAGTLATLSDLMQGLPRVAETVTDLFRADSTHIVLAESPGGGLVLVGFDRARGRLAPAPAGLTLSEAPLTRQVLQEQRPLVVTARRPVETTEHAKAFLQSRNIQSFLVVPLLVGGATVGVMSVNSAQAERAFAPEEVRLAETIAVDVAAAVANLHLLGQTHEAAAMQERQRIAGELHDSVTQRIYSVSIMAQTLPRLLEKEKLAEAKRNATQIRLMTLGALAQMRTLLFELRPSALAEASLGLLLRQLGDMLMGQLDVPVDVVVSGEVQPPVDVKIALYRITQEAFNNIAKHAEASQVTVRLQGSAKAVELTVEDDGRGFDSRVAVPGRMGLPIMVERAEGIGARLQLDSHPDRGTKITVFWEAR